MFKPGIEQLKSVFARKGYKLKTREYELNIVGIRNNNAKPNSFDDTICVLFKDEYKDDVLLTFSATTDPGLYWLENPMQKEGCAILKEGQYEDAYVVGLHRGKYKALVQRGGKVTVIRDGDRDKLMDNNSANEISGYFGINIHRAKERGTTTIVDRFSAGCQVLANAEEFDEFMELCEKSRLITGRNRFTYTLINVLDLKHA